MDREQADREDMQFLVQRPEFIRFLWRVIQLSHIFARAANGSQDEAVAKLARRNLGLEILEMVEAGQPVAHPDNPVLTLIQILREEAIQQQETKNGPRRKHDRNAELRDDGDTGSDD